MLDTRIGVYKGAFDNKSERTTSLNTFIDAVKNGKYKDKVHKLRQLTGDHKDDYKKTLPAFTLSGTFKGGRTEVHLHEYNYQICIDFDDLTDLEKDKERLKDDPYSYVISKSVSGEGLFTIVRLERIELNGNVKDYHVQVYHALEKYYKEKYGFITDKSCKDINRLRYISYDPAIYVNDNSTVFSFPYSEPENNITSPPDVAEEATAWVTEHEELTEDLPVKRRPRNSLLDKDVQRVRTIVREVEEKNILLGDDSYDNWLKLAFALSSMGEEGRGLFHKVSAVSPKYDFKACDEQFDKVLSKPAMFNGVTIATFFHYAKEAGLENNNPIIIHLIDLEHNKYIGKPVSTNIVVGGIGEVFHVPKAWDADCGRRESDDKPCPICPKKAKLSDKNLRLLLNFCRMSDSQKLGAMRAIVGCREAKVNVTEYTTITELLALPVADERDKKDYRDKIVYYIGNIKSSSLQYSATGYVIAEPKKQKASLIIHKLEQLETDIDKFTLTEEIKGRFKLLQPNDNTIKEYLCHKKSITKEITSTITRIYGEHRERVLFLNLLVYHSPISLKFNGSIIKGVLDALVAGDTGEGKTTMFDRIRKAIGLGNLTSASTSSRTGILYHLDSKVNDKRILRWGEFPLSHGGLLGIDEAQKLPMDQWDEFTSARSEGILRVNRTIKSEHPCKTRLIVFANPANNKPMSQFQYGIEVVAASYSFLRPADLRRFDAVAIVNTNDQDINEVMQIGTYDKSKINKELLRDSVLWAWTRKRDDFVYGGHSLDAIRDLSKALIDRYKVTEIPLVVNDIQEKIARIGFSIATLFHSTDENHEKVILNPLHIALAGETLRELYDHPNCRLDQYVKVVRSNSNLTDDEYEKIKHDFLTPDGNREDVIATEEIFNAYLTGDVFSKSDIEAMTGLSHNPLGERIRKLRKHRLILSKKGGYQKTARMINFLDRWIHEISDTPL